jgi:hypothetical protein
MPVEDRESAANRPEGELADIVTDDIAMCQLRGTSHDEAMAAFIVKRITAPENREVVLRALWGEGARVFVPVDGDEGMYMCVVPTPSEPGGEETT